MNSKVNFHGQEIDLEQVSSYCTLYKREFKVSVKTSFGAVVYYFTNINASVFKLELDELLVKYSERKIIDTKIAEQQKIVNVLNDEAISANIKIRDARNELNRLVRIKDDYR